MRDAIRESTELPLVCWEYIDIDRVIRVGWWEENFDGDYACKEQSCIIHTAFALLSPSVVVCAS